MSTLTWGKSLGVRTPLSRTCALYLQVSIFEVQDFDGAWLRRVVAQTSGTPISA